MDVAAFDFDLPAHGYAWTFPKSSHLSVGVLSVGKRSPGLPSLLEEYLRRTGIETPLETLTLHQKKIIEKTNLTACAPRDAMPLRAF